MTWYFAYGSNMASSNLRERGVRATAFGPASLAGYRLAFTLPSSRWGGHAADIVVDPGAVVHGVLWRLERGDALDRWEGGYRRIEVTVGDAAAAGDAVTASPVRSVEERERPPTAFTYQVLDERRALVERPPSARYLERLVEGAREFGLPPTYLDFLESSRR